MPWKILLTLLFKMGFFDSVWQWWVRFVVRGLQAALCLLSLIFLSSGFAVGTFNGRRTVLGGSYAMTTALLTFLGFVYSLWWFGLIELAHISPRPSALYSVVMDTVLALCLLAAAIVLLVSDFVRNCVSFGALLRCSSLNATVVLLFCAMASFILSPWLLYSFARRERKQRERERSLQNRHSHDLESPQDPPYHHQVMTPSQEQPYHQQGVTPTNALAQDTAEHA